MKQKGVKKVINKRTNKLLIRQVFFTFNSWLTLINVAVRLNLMFRPISYSNTCTSNLKLILKKLDVYML